MRLRGPGSAGPEASERPSGEAIEAFRRAAWLQPDEPDYHFILGEALLRVGRADEAAAAFEEATWVRPADPQYHAALGVALRVAERGTDAVSAFREAARLAPRDGRALNGLGVCLMEAGQTGEGLRTLRRSVALDPHEAEPHLNLGLALLAAGNAAEAVGPLRRAADLDPTDPEPRALLGRALHDAGRDADARSAFREALRLDPRYLEERPELKAASEACTLTQLRRSLEDDLTIQPRRLSLAWAPFAFLADRLPGAPRRIAALVGVLALAFAGVTTLRLARVYLNALALREDVAAAARTPVRDDGEVRARLATALDRRGLGGVLRPEQFTVDSRRSFRRITCDCAVPFSPWPGLATRLPFRIDVEGPIVVPGDDTTFF